MKLKPGSWLGYSASTTEPDAREHAARRLGCSPQDVEVESNGGAVLVRRKDEDLRTIQG